MHLSQQCPLNLYLIKNQEDIVVFLGKSLKVFNSDNFLFCLNSHNIALGNDKCLDRKGYHNNLFRRGFKRYHCESDMNIFKWSIDRNYVNSPFKKTNNDSLSHSLVQNLLTYPRSLSALKILLTTAGCPTSYILILRYQIIIIKILDRVIALYCDSRD